MYMLGSVSLWMSQDFVRMEALGVGCFFAVFVTLFHVTVLNKIMSWYRDVSRRLQQPGDVSLLPSVYFSAAVLLMLLLHILDALIWGCLLFALRLVPNIHDALYFSANTYTSLGYGTMLLNANWRQVSPIMAMSGLFTFACTTGQLFNVMGYHRDNVDNVKARRE